MFDLILDDNAVLGESPGRAEAELAKSMGGDWLSQLDQQLLRAVSTRNRKCTMVVTLALEEMGLFPPPSHAYIELALRRLNLLRDNGVVVGFGDMRRPRFSEVCLPAESTQRA